MDQKFHFQRILFLFPGLLALLTGVVIGLIRGGVPFNPIPFSVSPSLHGPLMISGFIGTVIGLERAVALQYRWVYLAPGSSALAVLLTLVSGESYLVHGLNLLGALILTMAYVPIYRVQKEKHVLVMATGSLSWFLGLLVLPWVGGDGIAPVVLLWAGFPFLTVTGERMELSRFRMKTKLDPIWFYSAVGTYFLGSILALFDGRGIPLDGGARLAGIGLVLTAAWLLKKDISMRFLKDGGQTGFSSRAIVSAWLMGGMSGVFLVFAGLASAGPMYDATLHLLFLGFLMPMIFAHAPVIFPAVLGVTMRWGHHFYTHLVLLHLGLLLRVSGDLLLASGPVEMGLDPFLLKQTGMVLNGISILLFLLITIASIRIRLSSRPGDK